MGLGIPEMMAIGGGLGLLSGGLKGGLQGAALGGLGGYGLDKLKGASFLQNSAAQAIPQTAAAPVATPATAGAAPFAGAVFNPSTQTWLNPEYFVGAGGPLATYTGGEGLLSNAYSNVKEYITPQNLMGVANVLSSMQPPQQMPQAPSGGVRQGSTQGLNVDMGGAKLIKRRGYA